MALLPSLSRLSLRAARTGEFAPIPWPAGLDPAGPNPPAADPDAPAPPPPPREACPVTMEDLPYGDATRTFRVAYTNPDGRVGYNWFDGWTLARHVRESIRQGRWPFNPCSFVPLSRTDVDALLARYPFQAPMPPMPADPNAAVVANDPNTPNTRLRRAIDDGDVLAIRSALIAGADPTVAAEGGNTALHVAAELDRGGNGPLVGMIINNLSNWGDNLLEALNARDRYGNAPLHLAARVGNVNAARDLLMAGANENLVNHNGFTPLHTAAVGGHSNFLDVLLARRGRGTIEAQTRATGNTALHLAAMERHARFVERLLSAEAAANVNARNMRNETPLSLALRINNTSLVRLVVQVLCTGGADVNVRDQIDNTPLHEAIDCGAQVVRLLLHRGADAFAQNVFMETPIELAQQSGFTSVADLLQQAMQSNPPLAAERQRSRSPGSADSRASASRRRNASAGDR